MSYALNKVLQAEAVYRAGDAEQAKAILTKVIQAKPGDAEAANLLALILDAGGDRERAAVFAERAHSINPRDWRFVNNFATILSRGGKRAKAIEVLRKGVKALPANGDLWAALAHELSVDSQFIAAAEAARQGLANAPGHARLASELVSILVEMGESKDAVEAAQAAAREHPESVLLASQLCHAMNYLPGATSEELLAAHRSFGDLLARTFPAERRAFARERDPKKRLRVALVSGDLRTHSCAYFIEGFLKHHDRGAIELLCYHTALGDQTTERLRPLAAGWRECAGMPDTMLAEIIRADAPDVAIDLSAHTCAATLLAFHSRVAPVQVTYLAYPNTTGVASMDFRLIDGHTDPAGSERWCTERLLRLSPSFLCYTPATDLPEVGPPPSQRPRERHPLGDGVIRFGSFNAAAKLSPEALRLWSRLLAEVPNSRLVLKASSFIDPLLRERVRERLIAWGAPADRLDILTPAMQTRDHLLLYAELDIGLDPFPYHGTTTTLEGMMMGVPVVTLAGERHASRVGVSLLTNAGLPGLAAKSEEEYVSIAARLACDPKRLAELRAGLREQLLHSVLCDAPAHARALEAALREAWTSWCSGELDSRTA